MLVRICNHLMLVRICNHLKEDGVYCGSPALRGRNYCYYHLNMLGRRLKRAQARRRGERYQLHLPVLENMHAVQTALGEVLEALAEGQLDSKTAGLMLYALQQAAANLNGTAGWLGGRLEVKEEEPGRALEYPGFEEKYGVPEGIDLEAEPEVALQQAQEHPETLPQTEEQAETLRQTEPRLERVPVKQIERDEEGEVTFEELTRALREAELIRAREAEKKPSASISIQKVGAAESA